MPYLYIKSCELNDVLFLQTTIILNKDTTYYLYNNFFKRIILQVLNILVKQVDF